MKLTEEPVKESPSLTKPYARGSYNKSNDTEQWIRISEGCPNKCVYCRESWECGTEPIYLEIPEIVRNEVKILDMNLTAKPKAIEIINDLGSRRVNNKVIHYELLCGVDYRYSTQLMANALHDNRFKNIRLAWDYGFKQQRIFKKIIGYYIKAGYEPRDIMIFMICNWRTPYEENLMKLDLAKIWGVQVSDCYFDNQVSPNIKPIHWTGLQIKDFRKKCRKHNQMVNYRIDPEYESINSLESPQATLSTLQEQNKILENYSE
jgi:hypothetical protein